MRASLIIEGQVACKGGARFADAVVGFSSTPVKATLVNWLPWTPFCLSSGDSRSVDFLAALRDEREDLSGKVTLLGSNGIELGMRFGESASDVVLGPLVGSQATDGDDVQRAIGGAISPPG